MHVFLDTLKLAFVLFVFTAIGFVIVSFFDWLEKK